MNSNRVGLGLLILTVGGMLAAGVLFAGTQDAPAPVRPVPAVPVTGLPTRHCATEDGAQPGQGYPCTWNCLTDGNRLCGPGPVRFLVYADPSECPVGRRDTVCPA
jgi:hypothetical protein